MTREEILNLKVGDVVRFPNGIMTHERQGAKVVSIHAQKVSRTLKGQEHAFVCFYFDFGPGSTISASTSELDGPNDCKYAELVR
jgi:hypothetical protein